MHNNLILETIKNQTLGQHNNLILGILVLSGYQQRVGALGESISRAGIACQADAAWHGVTRTAPGDPQSYSLSS